MNDENPAEYRTRRSVLAGLTDLQFQHMITPRLIGWMYAGTVIVIGGSCLWCLLLVWWLAYWAGWAWWVLAPVVIIGGLVATLAARVTLEWVLMAFTRGRTIPSPLQPARSGIDSWKPPSSATSELPRSQPSFPTALPDGDGHRFGDQ